MTQNFAADVLRFTEEAKQNMEYVFRGSVEDISELMTRRQESMWNSNTGKQVRDTFDVGFVPVDTGELINSVEVSVNGAITGQGANKAPPDFVASLAGLELGGVAEIYFTAPHARPLHYGFTTASGTQVPGRLWVTTAIQQWPAIVDANAALFKD
jgi:hypothetical protein